MTIKWIGAFLVILLGISCVLAYDDDFVVITDQPYNPPNNQPYNPPYNPPNNQPYNPPNNQQNDQGGMYSFSISESPSTLIDEDSSNMYAKANVGNSGGVAELSWTPGGNQNIFWIVSRDGTRNTRYLDMPLYSYARALMIPATTGMLRLYETYPSGQTREYNLGYVNAYRNYRIWFFADSRGTHTSMFSVNNGPFSDTLTHNVN